MARKRGRDEKATTAGRPAVTRAPLPPPILPPIPAVSPAGLRPVVLDTRSLFTAALAVVVLYGAWTIRDVLVTLMFAFVLTFLGAPVVARLEARGVPRALGTALFLGAALSFVAALLALVVPTLVTELIAVFQGLPAAIVRLLAWIEATTGRHVPRSVSELTGAVSTEVMQRISSMAASSGSAVGKGAFGVLAGAVSALGFVAQAFLVPVLAFFLLVELEQSRAFTLMLLPQRARGYFLAYGPLVDRALSGLVRGQATVAAVMALIYVVGLSLAGVPLALAIGILSGVAYLVPFASALVCIVLAVTFALLELGAQALWPIAGAVITAVVVQLLEGWVLTPRIVGENAGLSPLAAILAVLFGGALFGFLGVLFALPVAAAIAVVLKEEMRRRGLVPAADAQGVGA